MPCTGQKNISVRVPEKNISLSNLFFLTTVLACAVRETFIYLCAEIS